MIGYYVHHHGRGHLARASCVAAASDEPVVALSSLPEPAGSPFAAWIALPPDPAVPDPWHPTAGGALHWAPLDSPGYRDRMAALARWAGEARPRLVVVDVSVEVTLLLRLLAVPVVVVVGPGERGDRAHESAFRAASRLVVPAPCPDPVPAHLRPFADKICWTGAFSRFDHLPVTPAPASDRVLVLLGGGGSGVDVAALAGAAAATPEWSWTAAGGTGRWVDDVWDALAAADVVVTHAGLGALAEVAAARRPAVVVPQDRPFGEQRATARQLAEAGLAAVSPSWPDPQSWPDLLAEARRHGGDGWKAWNDGDGARRFVDCLRTADE